MLRLIDQFKIEVTEPVRADKVITGFLKNLNPFVNRQVVDAWFAKSALSVGGRPLQPFFVLKPGHYTVSIENDAAAQLSCNEIVAWVPTISEIEELRLHGFLSAHSLSTRASSNLASMDDLRARFLLLDHPDFFVLNKPSGVSTVPLTPWEDRSVVQLGLALFPEWASGFGLPGGGFPADSLELGLAHRLDEGTSGAVLCAKTAGALVSFREMFRDGRMNKKYLALSASLLRAAGGGDFSIPGFIREPIVALTKTAKRVALASAIPENQWRGKPMDAVTEILSLDVLSDSADGEVYEYSVRIHTGVRHQIRVHFASHGAPLIGDPIYTRAGAGPGVKPNKGARLEMKRADSSLRAPEVETDSDVVSVADADEASPALFERLGLHASELEFVWNGETVKVVAGTGA